MNIPKLSKRFETSLASSLSASGTTFSTVSATDDDGNALSGLYALSIDVGNADVEDVIATVSGTTWTIVYRGIDADAPNTEVSANKKAHRRGAPVVITDYPLLAVLRNILNGEATLPNLLQYDTSVVPVTAHDIADKGYVDSVVAGIVTTVNVIVPGTAGETVAAGNLIYFDDTDNEWKKCDADTAATVENALLGIAQGAGTDGNTISGGVLLRGLDANQSGLTAGAVYYASNTAGAISSSAGTKEVTVGFSYSTTQLYFNPRFNQQITEDEQDALQATTTPSSSNKFVTQKDFQKGVEIYAADSVGTDAYAITLSPAITAYAAGQVFRFKAGTANTGAATLNVNSVGAKAIKKNYNADLEDNDIKANQVVEVAYDAVNDTFQLLSPPAQLNAVAKLSAVTGNVTVANSGTETNLFSYSVVGNTLGTANGIRVKVIISAAGATGSPTLTLRLKYGATTVATVAVLLNTTFAPFVIEGFLLATGATNSQEGSLILAQSYAGVTNVNQFNNGGAVGTAAEDSTADKNLIVSAQWSAADPANTITMAHAIIEKIA